MNNTLSYPSTPARMYPMTTRQRTFLKFSLYAVVLIFCAFYAYVQLITPTTGSNTLGLTSAGINALRVSFIALYFATLILGVQAVIAIWNYATQSLNLGDAAKERGLVRIGYGVLCLVLGLALATSISSTRTLLAPTGTPITALWQALTVIINYVYVLSPALGLSIIYSGAKLSAGSNTILARSQRDNLIVATIFSAIVTVFYGVLTFTNPTRQVSADLALRPTYVISDPLIMFTLILPSFFVWILGILAAFELDRITPKESTPQQRAARKNMVNGLWEIIFSSILIQTLLSLGGGRLLHLGLFFILFAIYGFFLLLIIGYFTIWRGASGLLKSSPPPLGR